jgi:hypothetical protein
MAKGNALGFSYNAPLALSQIRDFLSEFKNAKVLPQFKLILLDTVWVET